MTYRKRHLQQLFYVTAALLLVTLIIYWTDGDRVLARMIFEKNSNWPGIDRFPWNMFYDCAALPGFILAGAALLVWGGSFFSSRLKKQRRSAIFLILLLALAPGLLVNTIFKDHLGRARPREIIACGGQYQYTEFWQLGTTGSNSSFPSGHAAIAFYPLAPWFFLREQHRKAAFLFLLFGLGFGVAVSLARMLQGGHFLSDVLWAGGIDYLVGGGLALIIRPGEQLDYKDSSTGRRVL